MSNPLTELARALAHMDGARYNGVCRELQRGIRIRPVGCWQAMIAASTLFAARNFWGFETTMEVKKMHVLRKAILAAACTAALRLRQRRLLPRRPCAQ
jgi:hypothetical protein